MRGRAIDLQWRLSRIWFRTRLGTARDGAIPQVQDNGLSELGFLLPLNQGPAGNRDGNQNASGDRQEGAPLAELEGVPELGKVAIARTAGSEVVEPFLSLGERHLAEGNPSQDVRTGTSGALRIGEFTE